MGSRSLIVFINFVSSGGRKKRRARPPARRTEGREKEGKQKRIYRLPGRWRPRRCHEDGPSPPSGASAWRRQVVHRRKCARATRLRATRLRAPRAVGSRGSSPSSSWSWRSAILSWPAWPHHLPEGEGRRARKGQGSVVGDRERNGTLCGGMSACPFDTRYTARAHSVHKWDKAQGVASLRPATPPSGSAPAARQSGLFERNQ